MVITKECAVDDDEQKEDCFHSLRRVVLRREHKNVWCTSTQRSLPPRKQSHLPDILGSHAASGGTQLSWERRLKATMQVIMLI